ncbi:mycothiol transferase [Saccharopolyspora sp. NPDC002376]
MTMPFPEPTTPAASRAEVFTNYLDFFRSRVIDKVQGLPDHELRNSRVPSNWTPLELVKHLTYVELRWIEWGFQGQNVENPWGDRKDDRWHVEPSETKEELLQNLHTQGRHTTTVIENTNLSKPGQPGPRWRGQDPATLERILFHLLQEYARHLGHLDIITEQATTNSGE